MTQRKSGDSEKRNQVGELGKRDTQLRGDRRVQERENLSPGAGASEWYLRGHIVRPGRTKDNKISKIKQGGEKEAYTLSIRFRFSSLFPLGILRGDEEGAGNWRGCMRGKNAREQEQQ